MRTIRRVIAALGLGAVAGCTVTGGVTSFSERVFLAGPVPAEMAAPDYDVFCPEVGIVAGGATIQRGGGRRLGSVVSLGQLARECRGQAYGSTLVKVGIEGRAVLSGTGPGRFDVPVRVVVKHRGAVLANRVLRGSIVIPAGSGHGAFAVVADDFVVPPSAAEDFQIEVGLGGAARARRG